MNAYSACFNGANTRAPRSDELLQPVGAQHAGRPSDKGKMVYGVYRVSAHDVKKCSEPILKAAESQPAMAELDQAAKAYASTLKDWAARLAEADQYYTREDYKDDGFAKGKAMHADLVKHYTAFDQSAKAYNAALDTENDKLQAALLAQVEKTEGKQFRHWHLASRLSAKQLIGVLETDNFDLASANAKLKAFEDATQGLNGFVSEQGQSQAPVMWSPFKSPQRHGWWRAAACEPRWPTPRSRRTTRAATRAGWSKAAPTASCAPTTS